MDTPGLLATGFTYAAMYAWIVDVDSLTTVPVVIDHATVDTLLPANYPAGTIREGTVLGKVTATGYYREYDDADGSPGQGVAVGVLRYPVRLRDPFGNTLAAGQKVFGEMVVGGTLNSSLLRGVGGALDANGLADLVATGKFIFPDLY